MLSTARASPSPRTSRNENLTKEILESHNIFFVENICTEWRFEIPDDARMLLDFIGRDDEVRELYRGSLPHHVRGVCQSLLQFDEFVPAVSHDESGAMKHLHEHFPTALDNRWTDGKSIEDVEVLEQWYSDVLRDHCRVANEALQLQYEPDESCWQHFLDRELFCDPRKSIFWHNPEGLSPGPRHLTRVMNRTWGASKVIRKLNDSERPSQPMPDFVFGFRVWISRKVSVTQDGLVKVARAKSNLSYQVLGELSRTKNCELHAMPLKRKDNEDARSNYLLAFPFAIVEVKKPNSDKSERRKCCLQAANAAATSLNIFDKLWDLANHTGDVAKDADTITPPVVSFTCIGPILRLWLCYTIKGTGDRIGHIMVPIWEGNLSTIYGIIQARRIYERLIRWVLECLHPRLSKLITKIRNNIARYDNGYETCGSDDLLSEDGGNIFRLFDPDTPKQKTPKRPETPRSMTTPNSAQSANTKHLTMPLGRLRARSAGPTTPSRNVQSTFATPLASTRTPSPISAEPNEQTTPSSKQSKAAESESLADQLSDMTLGDRRVINFTAKLRHHGTAAMDNKANHVEYDSGSDDEYYSAEDTFKDAEEWASIGTPTKNARSR